MSDSNTIEELMSRISPAAQETVKKSLRQTLFAMIVEHQKERAELDEIERELGSENFGSW